MRYILLFLIVLPSFALLSLDPPHRLGCLPEDPTQIEWIKPSDIVPAPTKASVDHSPDMPPMGNQGNQGSCVAWAIAYYFKTYQEWVEHGWDVSLSNYQFSPAFMYNLINGGSDDGAKISDGFKLLSDLGCATLIYSPYDDNDYVTWPTEEAFSSAIPYRGSTTHTINISNDTGIAQLKTLLQNGYNAVISITCYDEFQENNLGPDYVYDTGDTSTAHYTPGLHAVCVVGFDDSKPTNDGTGAFKIVNSWGTYWGDNGYFWMSYAAIKDGNMCQGYAYYQDDRINYEPKVKIHVHVTYNKREYLTFLVGNISNKWTKTYFDWSMGDKSLHDFPSNPIVLDMTDAFTLIDPYIPNDTLYIRVQNGGIGNGTIDTVFTEVLTWGSYDPSYELPKNLLSYQTVQVNVLQSNPPIHWSTFHGYIDRVGSSGLSYQHQYGSIKWNTSVNGVPTAPAIGDMDYNGIPDVVIATSSGYLYIIDGSNGTTLSSYGPINAAIYGTPAIGDFDADDTLEIVFEAGDSVYFLDNNCNLIWQKYYRNSTASSPVITNMDGDMPFEIVITGQTNTVRVLKGSDGNSKWFYTNTSAPVLSSPAVGDVDGNGITNVVITSVNGSIYAVERRGTSFLSNLSWTYPTGDSIYASPVLSDLDKDGRYEVITGSDDGYLYAIHGDGTLYWRIDLGSRIRTTAAIDDINGDSYDEIAVGTENALYIIDYAGNILQNIPMANITASPVIFDADGDGDKDIVFGTVDSLIMAYDYTGNFLWSLKLDGIPQSSPAIGDIDGDGYGEIVIGTDNGTLYALNSSTTGIPSVENKRTFTINGLSGNVRVILSGFRTKNFAISIYDLTGRKIFTTAKELKSGSESFDLKPEIPSGIYFLKLETDGFTGIKKFTLLK